MTNMNFVSRTNNFRVKDAAAFTAALTDEDVVGWGDVTVVPEANETFSLVFHDGEPELFPQTEEDPKDVKELISRHLPEGEVVVFIDIANEGMHSISASGTVLTHKNERKEVNFIDDLFKLAESIGHVSGTLDD